MGTRKSLPMGSLCFWLLHHRRITSAQSCCCGGFEGNKPQNFLPMGGLIPTGMPTAETPTVSILAGVHWEGNTGAQPRRSGIEKGMRCCSKSPLLANGALTDHAQAMQQLSPPLAHLVWFLAGLTDWCSIHGAAPNVCDPLPGLLLGSESEWGFSASNKWFYVN